jgi:hypothetical protein
MIDPYVLHAPAGRGLPGGKLLSFASPKVSNQRKGDPNIPEFPKLESAGRASKNSPRLAVLILFFVSETQTPSPLIRPADSIFGGAVRGKSQKQNRGKWAQTLLAPLKGG